MSFLVSFKGQFSPYVYPSTEGWNAKIHPVHNIDALNTSKIEQHHEEEVPVHHPVNPQIHSYEQQVKSFEKEKKRSYARDIMSSPVHFIQKSSPQSEAVELMRKYGFKHLPVIDPEDNLVGLLSDRELIGASVNASCEELMIPKVLVAIQSAWIQEIAQIMLQEKVHALPIIDEHHHVVGIITPSDILRFVISEQHFFGKG